MTAEALTTASPNRRPKSGGRQSLPGGPLARIQVNLPAQLLEMVDEVAAQRFCYRADLVKDWIVAGVQRANSLPPAD